MKMTTRAIVIIAAALMILAGVGMAYADDGSLQRVLKAEIGRASCRERV